MRTTANRFWKQVRVGNGCWLWKGSTFTPKGYGAFHVSDKVGTVSAHRFSRSAAQQIEQAGGEVVVLSGKTPVSQKQKQKKQQKQQKQQQKANTADQ